MDFFTEQDSKFMKRAIALAEKGRGHTNPNPMVGAVIVKDGEIISEGYHKKAGCAHAEIEAIKAAISASAGRAAKPLKGSTMYVSLEPCTIFGKTPPCVNEIVKYGFKEIVVATADPNPKINGTGIKFLEKSGIRVRKGLLEDKVKRQNEVFFKHISAGMPFVCVKIASSLDGKLAAKSSDSKWITSRESRQAVQKIRKDYGCILTGINTVLKDDPLLAPKKRIEFDGNLKDNIYNGGKNFTRVILDSNLKIDENSKIIITSDIIKTIIFADSRRVGSDREKKTEILKRSGTKVIFLEHNMDNRNNRCIDNYFLDDKNSSSDNYSVDDKYSRSRNHFGGNRENYLNLIDILKILYKDFGITKLLLECGPTLLTSFLKQSLIDKFIIFLAPKILGQNNKYDIFGDLGIEKVSDSLKLRFDKIEKSGPDIKITAYPDRCAEECDSA